MTELTDNSDFTERTAMLHDWGDLAMAHLDIAPRCLQPAVPLPLDTFTGRAYLSLVPFRLKAIRCPVLPRLTRVLLQPVSDHRLLNVRTYVRHPCGRAGIYFLREFTDHRLHCLIAPLLYGTPYCLARFAEGSITRAEGSLRLTFSPYLNPTTAAAGSLDHFLLERYSAWCDARGRLMRFDIDHPPWRFCRAVVRYHDTSLLDRVFPWFRHARPVTHGGGHVCLPMTGVRISFPKNAPGEPSPDLDSHASTHPRRFRHA